MIRERKLARSYSNAIFDLALEQDALERVKDDMLMITKLLEENVELQKVLSSPVIRSGKKIAVLDAILEGYIHQLTQKFLHLLIKSLRVLYLYDIADQYLNLYKKHKGIITVNIKTAIPLPHKTRLDVINKIMLLLKSDIDLTEAVDNRLIGGFIAQIDDKRYDASLRSKLNKLDRQFDINIYKKEF